MYRFFTVSPPLQDVVPWGLSYRADTGDDAEGRCGPHSAPSRAHHTPVQSFSGCLRSSLHPRAQPVQLWIPWGAQAEAPHQAKEHTSGHIYRHGNWHTKSSTTLLKEEKSAEAKTSPLIASISTGRQQTALSLDISTWHVHAFLKCFFPAPGKQSVTWYIKSWDREEHHKEHKDPGWFGPVFSRMGHWKQSRVIWGRTKRACW